MAKEALGVRVPVKIQNLYPEFSIKAYMHFF